MTDPQPFRPGARRLVRRGAQLALGLVLYGVSTAMVLLSTLGNIPWDVLHQGLSDRTGISIGLVAIVVGFGVLLAWLPLRERPGIGTVANVIVVGVVIDLALAVVEAPSGWPARIGLLLGGVVLNAMATGAYVGARLGPGPRDGLMTGLARRTGRSVRLVRTAIEVSVVLLGFLLGGRLGIGTAVYAVAIGPLIGVFLPLFTVRTPPDPLPRGS